MIESMRWTCGALLVTMAISCSAYGQSSRRAPPSQVPRYTPKSPTVSPYLGLLNRNGTPATNYFGLVRRLNVKRA